MILENEKIKQALEYIKEEDPVTTQDTLNMCQIPAPSYKEEKKAEYIRERFREIGLRDVRIDAVGNVLGIWPGTGEGPSVMLAAHTDTVFPEGTDLSIRKEGNRYYCPGINDDTHAVAEMIAVAKAMIHADLHTKGDLIFCANVCEEGLGDLRGVKYLFGYDNKASEECPEVDAFVSIDNQYTGGVIYTATGSHRYEVTFTGRGGHSFQNFGIPNPIHAMGRAIAQIAEFQVPNEPKTTFNVGVIQGGTSVNTISGSASMLVDLRSDSEEELKRDHSGIPHGGFVLRSGVTGWEKEHKHMIEYSLKLDSNPEFTSCVIVAYARAAYRLAKEGQTGCRTVFDIAPAYLSAKSGEELRASML